MESLLQSLSLGVLLRCLASGILGVLAFRVALADSLKSEPLTRFEPYQIGAALLFGVVIYGIHRSLVYPLIEGVLDSKYAKSLRGIIPLISISSREALHTRWDRADEKDTPNSGIAKHTTGWADWAHMQYSSSWCILIGLAYGTLVSTGSGCRCILILFPMLFAAAAIISDWRLHSVEDYLSSKRKNQN